jgi:hypothetical protein
VGSENVDPEWSQRHYNLYMQSTQVTGSLRTHYRNSFPLIMRGLSFLHILRVVKFKSGASEDLLIELCGQNETRTS